MSKNQPHQNVFSFTGENTLFVFAKHKTRNISLLAKEGGKKEHELFKNKIIVENLLDNIVNFIC